MQSPRVTTKIGVKSNLSNMYRAYSSGFLKKSLMLRTASAPPKKEESISRDEKLAFSGIIYGFSENSWEAAVNNCFLGLQEKSGNDYKGTGVVPEILGIYEHNLASRLREYRVDVVLQRKSFMYLLANFSIELRKARKLIIHPGITGGKKWRFWVFLRLKKFPYSLEEQIINADKYTKIKDIYICVYPSGKAIITGWKLTSKKEGRKESKKREPMKSGWDKKKASIEIDVSAEIIGYRHIEIVVKMQMQNYGNKLMVPYSISEGKSTGVRLKGMIDELFTKTVTGHHELKT
jgi:hypothetical protein